MSSFIETQKDIKSVYILGQNYSHGVQVAKYAKETLARKRPDIQIVGEDLHPLAQARDFAPYIAKNQGLRRRHGHHRQLGLGPLAC
jgi:branched-chain amino acid transport system substrate-binding protein